MLSIPNIASDRANIQRNAQEIKQRLESRGVIAQLVTVPGANPVVFGELRTPGATRTIGLYAHYDGQPLDPKEWATPPFEPTLRSGKIDDGAKPIALPQPGTPFNPEWRLYARSAGDDKAAIIAMLAAIEALRDQGVKLKSNIKFAFEGEEEAESANLEKIIAANKSLFAADVWLMCDGPVQDRKSTRLNSSH